jgi:drug/metabolite transporter (DMT)-like permease
MTPTALALVLTAAVLHAVWNAFAKRSGDQLVFLWLTTCVATVLLLPLAAGKLRTGGLPGAAVPFVVATIVLHAFYFYALGRSYRSGAFSLVYPIARGLGVALVPLLALVLFDEWPSPAGALGIGLVIAGVVALHLAPVAVSAALRSHVRLGPGTWWALATGLTIASYSLVDKAGVARLHPVPYMALMEAGCAVLLLPAALRRGTVRREWAAHWPTILAAGAMSAAAYTLVLFAFQLAKTGYVVAARELSIVLSALIGSLWLGEGRLGPRLAGAAVVLAGVACVAAAGR